MRKNFVKIGDLQFPVKCLYSSYRHIETKSGRRFSVFTPCGKCYNCRRKKAADWSYRLEVESEDTYVYNLMLTYADDKLPIYKGVPSLNRQQVTEAIKRFRYYFSKYGITIRIFLVGEYAPETLRPHYHAIIFADKPLNVIDNTDYLFDIIKEELQHSWPYGYVFLSGYRGDVGKMVGYMCTYMFTGLSDFYHNNHIKPFKMQSRGLGERWPLVRKKEFDRAKRTKSWCYKYKDKEGKEHTTSYPRYFLRKFCPDEVTSQRQSDFIEYCKQFHEFLIYDEQRHKGGINTYIQTRNNRIASLKSKERDFERENFRQRKIHKNNRHTK